MVARSFGGERRLWPAAWLLAVVAVLPLLAPEVWSGFRVALSDPILAALAPNEQPLSVRSPGGVWAIGLAVVWFGLAYWRRDLTWWESALVILGGAAALARLGNAWLDALAMVLPLARQIGNGLAATAPRAPGWSRISRRQQVVMTAATACLCVIATVVTLLVSRPTALPVSASRSAAASPGSRIVFADWRWAPGLQSALGGDRRVLAASGLAGESGEFWLDYIRVSQGHERWAAVLARAEVDLVVLDAADQQSKAAALVRTSPEWHVLSDADGALVAERARP